MSLLRTPAAYFWISQKHSIKFGTKDSFLNLKTYGIEGSVLALLGNFLSERQQRVFLNGKCSAWKNIFAGVPRGSVLGPLLFFIYINDLPDTLQPIPYPFADNVSLFDPIYNPIVSTVTLALLLTL